MATILPRPDINVSPRSDGVPGVDIVIARDGKAKSYQAVGTSTKDIVKDAVEKVLNDPVSAEWLP